MATKEKKGDGLKDAKFNGIKYKTHPQKGGVIFTVPKSAVKTEDEVAREEEEKKSKPST